MKNSDDARRRIPAVVLGVEHPRALAAIRSLGRAGIPLVAVDHQVSAGFCSRYLGARHLIGNDSDEALAALDALARKGGGVLIPTSDRYLVLVGKNSDRLSRSFVLTTPPWEVLGRVLTQPECYAIAREAGIATPRFFQPRDADGLDEVVAALDLDHHEYLLKTMPGTQPADARTGRFTKVAAADPAAVRRQCLEIFGRTGGFPMIVEVVPGEADRCIGVTMVVDRQHEAVISYCVRRLKLHTYSRSGRFVHPYELGANVFCESIRDLEAIEAARSFVRHARYYGAITVEFRRDPADRLVLIKADPRLVRATSLSTALGLDVPTTLYRVAVAGGPAPRRTYPEGVAWMWLTAYLSTLWRNRSDHPVRRELLNLPRNLRRVKAFAHLDARDPVPFLVHAAGWVAQPVHPWAARLIRALKGRIRGPRARPASPESPGR